MSVTSPLALDVNSREVQNIPLEGETIFEYNEAGNLVREITTLTTGFKYEILYEYNEAGNIVKQIVRRL